MSKKPIIPYKEYKPGSKVVITQQQLIQAVKNDYGAFVALNLLEDDRETILKHLKKDGFTKKYIASKVGIKSGMIEYHLRGRKGGEKE